ncbi:hypothetical protein BHE74_00008174, partial [Ensete ventricosum]
CDVFRILHDDSLSGRLNNFFSSMWRNFLYMLEHSYVSLVGTLLLTVASVFFLPTKLSRKSRAVIGVLHVSAHMFAALILMLLLELAIDICVRNRLLATAGVPKDWKLDSKWDTEPKQPLQLSHLRKFPSKWTAATGTDPVNSVRIVDHFVIQKTPSSTADANG